MRRAGDVYVLASGAALLAGQGSWSRLASVPVGGSFASGMTTLSAAMAGLGLGAFLAGAGLRRVPPRTLLAAVVPGCAAALALTPLLLLHLGGSFLGRWAATAALLAAAHVPFGMIVPCVAGRSPTGSRSGVLYAWSSLGGMAGALGLPALLAPRWGFDEIGFLLAVASVAVGLPAWGTAPREKVPETSENRRSPASGLTLAVLLGLLSLLSESLWLRLLGFYWESNAETFGLVLAATIGGTSVGSVLGRHIPLASGLTFSAVALTAAAAASPLALQAFTEGERLRVALLLAGIPSVGFGASFAQLLARSPGQLPALAGANAAGAAAAPLLLLLGAPAAGWPARVLVGAACGAGLAAAALGRRPGRALVKLGLLAAVAFLLVPGSPPPSAYRPGSGAASDFEATVLPFQATTGDSTVAVTRDTRSGVDILWIDRGFQGDTSPLGRRIPAALGRIPCGILGRSPRRALAIGLGTGATLAALMESGASSVDVAELNRGVVDANRTVLAETNGRVLERPGVRVHAGDGRTLLEESGASYDLIVTDMMFPTVAGAGNLFSREFYALARSRLAADGVFVHWLPGFLLAPEDLASIAAAFLEAFPDGTAWVGYLDARRLILGLAGGAVAEAPAAGARGRRLLGPSDLRALAAGARPLRDADPRLEFRSNRRGEGVEFGRENLLRLAEGLRRTTPSADGEDARRAWLLCAEAGLAEEGSDRALALYREAARASPDADDAEFAAQTIQYERRLAQARTSALEGDAERALLQLRKAASNPLYGGANLQLGEALAAAGRVEDAIRECEAAARKNPRSADASIRLAWLACAAGDREKARRALDAALRLRPDLPPLYEELARRLYRPSRP